MTDSGYGLWPLVALDTVLFAVFAASFFHPRTGRDWRAMGAFTGFLVALFTEMYGAPLTVYLRLARNEEREVAGRLGDAWAAYAARTPAFVPAALRHPLRTMARTGRRAES